jgi:hypothetical protein
MSHNAMGLHGLLQGHLDSITCFSSDAFMDSIITTSHPHLSIPLAMFGAALTTAVDKSWLINTETNQIHAISAAESYLPFLPRNMSFTSL